MSRVRAVEVPCVLNIAAVKLRFKEYDEAIHECNKVLGIGVRHLIQELTEPYVPLPHCYQTLPVLISTRLRATVTNLKGRVEKSRGR